ncbi:Response regulator [Sulfitobacter mediterraneus KCTC 32188]|nr:Response regulator [Sulfitobacter mediterraneus KCTC 32188]
MRPRKLQEARFLIVDDDEISVMAMQRAMRKLKISNETHVCTDGQHALEFLQSEQQKKHRTAAVYCHAGSQYAAHGRA